jgi:hypothetical protein
MFTCKTVKLLAVSFLSVLAAQVAAEQNSSWVDFSDPTAVYSKAGMAAGTEGVDLYAALAGYLGGQFKHKLTVEAMHDLDYYNVNYFAFNTANDTGFSVDTTWGDIYDKASVGLVKKLILENRNIKVYPAMKLGVMWDDSIPSTTFIELDAAVRYNVNRYFWVGVTPNYTYALRGLDIKDLDATVDMGYQLAKEVAVSAHVNNDEELWADFTFAF